MTNFDLNTIGEAPEKINIYLHFNESLRPLYGMGPPFNVYRAPLLFTFGLYFSLLTILIL